MPDADWDRSNGRIYKVEATNTKPLPKFDLAGRTTLLRGLEQIEERDQQDGDWDSDFTARGAATRARIMTVATREFAAQYQLHVQGRALPLQRFQPGLTMLERAMWSQSCRRRRWRCPTGSP